MLRIFQAVKGRDDQAVRDLFWAYLQWATPEVNREFGVGFDEESLLERDMCELAKFQPPDGRLLLAEYEGEMAGIACMKKIREDLGEIKRMYVSPQFRRRGIGRALGERLIQDARVIGYRRIWLDSPSSWKGSHALYRSLGFREIGPYPESEIPVEFQPFWIFMELRQSP